MKRLIIVLISILIHTIYGNSNNQKDNCKCKINNTPIISFQDKNDNRLIFCDGKIEKKLAENKYVISGFQLLNCYDNKIVLDESLDEVPSFIVTVEKDSLLFTDTHPVLNSEWAIDNIPATERTIKFINRQLYISPKRNVFTAPQITKEQQDSLITLTKNLKEIIKPGKKIYPYDENTIFLLFMGAINGNEDAKYLLKNLDSLFNLDGAVAETLGELWMDF